MRFKNFLEKRSGAIIAIITVMSALLTIFFICIDASRNIDDQINDLYAKERLVSQDFASVYELNDVTCYINDNNNVIIFHSKDCTLKVTYSKDGELLTKELADERVGSNLLSSIVMVLAICFITFCVSGFLLVVLVGMLDDKEKQRQFKEKQAKNEAVD